jgi:hypothetical protein
MPSSANRQVDQSSIDSLSSNVDLRLQPAYNYCMNKLKILKYPILIVVSTVLFIGFFLLGSKYALDHLIIRQITPTQAANAMKDDHFWVSYREYTLLITGEVTYVAKSGNNTVVGLKTDSSYSAECSLVNFNGTITKGQTIKIVTIANAAERESSGVKLNNCLMP